LKLSAFIILFLLASYYPGYATYIDDDLNRFKKEDNLIDWLDLRLNYVAENPRENLNFLLKTQEKVWRNPRNINEHISWAYLLINQGYYQLYNGDILQSINKYEDAYAYYQKHQLPIDIEEYVLKPLANNYTRTGDYERAIFIQQKSLDLALTQKTDTLIASIYNNLAISYRYNGKLEQALTQVKKGLQHSKPQNHIYGLLLSTSADILFEQEEYKEALTNASKAIQYLSGKKNTSYWLSGAHSLAGNIYLFNNDLDRADLHFNQALHIIKTEFSGSRKRELAHVLTLKSKLALQKQEYRQALVFVNQSIKSLVPEFDEKLGYPQEKQLYAEYKLRAALIQKAAVLKQIKEKNQALKGYKLAFYVSEKLRTEYTYTSSKKQLQEESKQLAEDIIETAYSLWLQSQKKAYAELILEISEQTKARLLFDDLSFHQEKMAAKNKSYADILKIERAIAYYERQKRTENHAENFDKKINELKFELSSLKKRENIKNLELIIDIKSLLSKIPVNTKAIVFFTGNRNHYIIDADNKGINLIKRLENAAYLEKLSRDFLNTYFYNGPSAMMNNPKDFFHQSYKIYNNIFEGVDNSSHQNLLIIKDGVYNYLSFDGLISKNIYSSNIKKWPFLMLNKSMRYQYSLYQFEAESPSKRKDLFSGFFLSNTQNNSIEIPSVRYEYDELKKFVQGEFYLNEEAQGSNFKKALINSHILHVSSHAYLSDSAEPVLEMYKDKFYLFELGDFTLPELVILNACQTANGQYVSGEGVENMGRGFLAAGSKAVISGIWKINDEAGARLLVSYYRHLLKNKNAHDALRQAKLNWLIHKETSNILALPYYWDSLIYTGQELEISVVKKASYNWFHLAGLVLMGGAALYAVKKNKSKIRND